MTFDQTIPRPKMPLIRPSSKHLPTTSRPLSRRLFDHGPDDCALQMTFDQTIPRPKMPLIRPSSKHCRDDGTDQTYHLPTTSRPLSRRLCNHGPHQTQTIVPTIVRVRWPLIRLSPKQKCHYSDQFLVEIWSGQGASLKWTKLISQTYNSI